MVKFWQIAAVLGGIVILFVVFGFSNKTDPVPTPITEQNNQVLETEQKATTTITNEQPKKNMIAIFKTSEGEFSLELANEKAPKTVENFTKLAQAGFYDGQRFHRIIEGFMIQGGDPFSKDLTKKAFWGTGDPGYKFADEFGVGLSNVTGTISMANSGPNTNGSQFFINVNDNIFLDGKHAVFGKVVSGMDVVMRLSKVDTDPSDKPLVDVVIEKVEIK